MLIFLAFLTNIAHALRYGSFDDVADERDPNGRGCVFDQNKPWPALKILDPADGVSFINRGGSLAKTKLPLNEIPRYTLHKTSNSRHNVYDIKLASNYLALFEDGKIGFAPSSSNGLLPRTSKLLPGRQFITSIFTISCAGDFSLSLPDVPDYGFSRHNDTQLTYIRHTPESNQIFVNMTKDKRSEHIQFIRRTMSSLDIENAKLASFSFLVGPVLISDKHQRGGVPRCAAAVPFGLTSVLRPGARETGFNGCGAENGVKIPDWRFTECCNDHDLCYDDCSQTWETCNDNFRDCNHFACTVAYPNPDAANVSMSESDWGLTRWGCHTLADVYADFVDSGLGKWSFSLMTDQRCMCRCPDGTFDCGKYCMVECEAINEDAVTQVQKGQASRRKAPTLLGEIDD